MDRIREPKTMSNTIVISAIPLSLYCVMEMVVLVSFVLAESSRQFRRDQ